MGLGGLRRQAHLHIEISQDSRTVPQFPSRGPPQLSITSASQGPVPPQNSAALRLEPGAKATGQPSLICQTLRAGTAPLSATQQSVMGHNAATSFDLALAFRGITQKERDFMHRNN